MLYLLVHIFIQPGQDEAFHQYERRVLTVFKVHGGAIIGAFHPENTKSETGKEIPHEIHVLSIPSEDAFLAYRNDPIVQSLKEEQQRVIRKMDVYRSWETLSY